MYREKEFEILRYLILGIKSKENIYDSFNFSFEKNIKEPLLAKENCIL